MKTGNIFLPVVLILALVLSGCNLPGKGGGTPTPDFV